MIAEINEIREARQAVAYDDDSEDRVESDRDVASVVSQLVSQSGGSNCGQEKSKDIIGLRLQLEFAKAEEKWPRRGR